MLNDGVVHYLDLWNRTYLDAYLNAGAIDIAMCDAKGYMERTNRMVTCIECIVVHTEINR